MPDPEFIGLGAMNMDRIYRVRNLVLEGEDVVEDFGYFAGGSAANTAYGMAKLGARCGFAGIVGDDPDGKRLVEDLASAGVDTSFIRVTPKAPTGTVVGLSDRIGRRAHYIAPGANSLLTYNDINIKYLDTARLLHISSFVSDDQFALLLKVIWELGAGVRLSFSPGSIYIAKGIKTLAPLLARTHILFASGAEIERLTGTGHVKGTRDLVKRGCKTVAVTFGQGMEVAGHKPIAAYVRDGDKEYEIETADSQPVPNADSTGAGDAFAAGFLFGMLKNKPLPDCARIGDLTARFSLTQKGARAGLPSLADLTRKYSECCGQTL